MQIKTILKSPYLHLLVIAVLTFICYGRILGSYFLADDFGELRYISQIYKGDFQLLLSNFTGNYMQIPSMAVYRPWLLMSLAIDFGIWKTNAFGYYLTNLAHYYACAVLIYLIIRKLTDYWGSSRSSLTALSAGAIFACNPLHCESISWVVGRVDIVCLSFYLAGLLLTTYYISARKMSFLVGSVICFWFAICTKEMAIGLPVMATVLAFLFPKIKKSSTDHNPDSNPDASGSTAVARNPLQDQEVASGKQNEFARESNVVTLQEASLRTEDSKTRKTPGEKFSAQLVNGFRSAKIVFLVFTICTITYFCIRFLALGTLTGGYTGSIGASQFSNIITKWLDPDSLFRILYPFNYALMKDGGIYRSLLSFAYFVTASLMISRIIFGRWPKRLLLFVLIWLLTTLAPIYQLYGLGYNLEGMRFLFFATAPLSVLIPVILFAPWFDSSDQVKKDSKILVLSTLAIAVLIFTFAKTSYINNSPWIEAGRQTKAVTTQIQKLAQSTPRGEKTAVLGIPKENAGSHMILNGPTLSFLLTPPFTDKQLSEKIVSFEPVLYGKSETINLQHFKWALNNKSIRKYYVWEFDKRSFRNLPFTPEEKSTAEIIEIGFPKASSVGGTDSSPPHIWPNTNGDSYSLEQNPKTDGVTFRNAFSGFALELTPLNIKPLLFDYLEIELPREDYNKISGKTIKISWNGLSSGTSKTSEKHLVGVFSNSTVDNELTTKIRIPLSLFWRWFTFDEINDLFIEFPGTVKLTILNTRLLPMEKIAPSLQVKGLSPMSYGTYSLAKENKLQLTIKPISISIPDSHHLELQIAKNNYFFENFKGDKIQNAIWKSIKIDKNSNKIDIKKSDFKGSGYNQIRAKYVGQNGDTFGEISYPITVSIPDSFR